jgi:hypothetical protein
MSVESKISKDVFVLLILLTNIQWMGPRDNKAGKGVDWYSTSTNRQLLHFFCQSTIMWQRGSCKFHHPTHNFMLAPEVYMSAINPQSASAKIWLGLAFAIQN